MLNFKTDKSNAELVKKKLLGGHEVRPIPESVSRLLTRLKDPNASMSAFAEIIESDMALSARLLRMVNSSLYGFRREVASIRQAVTILGQRSLNTLALTYAGASILSGHKTKRQCEALWSHSIACGTVARILANKLIPARADEAFLAGIFHDIGKLFFLDVLPSEYPELFESSSGIALSNRETILCGLTHAEAGLQLTVNWPLSDNIKGVIRYHHQPDDEAVENELTTLVFVANQICRSFGIGSPPNQSGLVVVDPFFDLEEDAIDSIVENAGASFQEARQIFAA